MAEIRTNVNDVVENLKRLCDGRNKVETLAEFIGVLEKPGEFDELDPNIVRGILIFSFGMRGREKESLGLSMGGFLKQVCGEDGTKYKKELGRFQANPNNPLPEFLTKAAFEKFVVRQWQIACVEEDLGLEVYERYY